MGRNPWRRRFPADASPTQPEGHDDLVKFDRSRARLIHIADETGAGVGPAFHAAALAELDRALAIQMRSKRRWRARSGTVLIGALSAATWLVIAGLFAIVSACANHVPDTTFALLDDVNGTVNRTVHYVAEADGRNEWLVAETEGDCEDFAIRKRRDLIRRGFPPLDLSVVVVPGHAMLVARTPRGAYVLDNRTDKVVAWNGKGREYLPLGAMWLPRDYVLKLAKQERETLELAATE
jgi:predicted transglutaminase-like cysteine proteinase